MRFLRKKARTFTLISLEHHHLSLATATTISRIENDTMIMQLHIFKPQSFYDLLSAQVQSTFILLLPTGNDIHEFVTDSPKKLHLDGLAYDTVELENNFWYVAGIRHELLFHYKLFFTTAQLPCMAVMTKLAASLLFSSTCSFQTLENLYHWYHEHPPCLINIAQCFNRVYDATI